MPKWIAVMLLVSLVIALLSPFASPNPDGLERVAKDKGFINKALSYLKSPMPNYVLPGMSNSFLATSGAGIIGTLITFAAAYYLGRIFLVKKAR